MESDALGEAEFPIWSQRGHICEGINVMESRSIFCVKDKLLTLETLSSPLPCAHAPPSKDSDKGETYEDTNSERASDPVVHLDHTAQDCYL